MEKNKLLSFSVTALFLLTSIAGCLGNEDEEKISAEDIVVSPEVMIGGEFQPSVITTKKDMSGLIPNLVVDPLSM